MATPVIGPVIAPVVNLPFNVPMQPLPGIVMKLLAAAVNATGIMDLQKTGTGSASVSHAADVYAPDHEGVYRKFGENEVVWAGGRVVRNLFPDLLTCATTYYTNFAGRTLVEGAGPNGEDVVRHTATAAATSMNVRHRDTTLHDTYLIARLLVRPIGQNMDVKLTVGNGSTKNGGEGPGWNDTIPLVADQWNDVTSWARNDTWDYRDVIFQNPGDGEDIVVDIVRDCFQLEDATGRSDLAMPSEYLPAETLQIFNYENGNSVLSSVVTESQGALLSPQPELQFLPDSTNSQIYSNDLVNAEWTATNVTPQKDAVGITGAKEEACTLTATAANGTVIANAVTAASNTHSAKWYLKRKTGSGVVELTLDGGTTWTDITSQLSAAFSEVVVDQAALVDPQMGVRIATSGDEIVVGNVELHLGKTKGQAVGTSPVFTTASAVSADKTVISFDNANHSDASGAYYFEWRAQRDYSDLGSKVPLWTFGNTGNANLYVDPGSNGRIAIKDNTNVASTDNNMWAAGDVLKLGFVYDDATSQMRLCVNGTWSAVGAYDGDWVSSVGNPIKLGGTTSNTYSERFSNFQRWSIPDFQAGIDKITELMT